MMNIVKFLLCAVITSPQPATAAPEAPAPLIVHLSIADGLLVTAKQVAALRRTVQKTNPGSKMVGIDIKSGSVMDLFLEKASIPSDQLFLEDVIHDFQSLNEDATAGVRRALIERMPSIDAPIRQLIIQAPIVSNDDTASGLLDILGLGSIDQSGLKPKLALALSPIRKKMAKDASIILIGGAALGPFAELNQRLASHLREYFAARAGRVFALIHSAKDVQKEMPKNLLSYGQKIGLGLAAGSVAYGLSGDGTAAAIIAAIMTPILIDAAFVTFDFARKRVIRNRQTKFGLNFKGFLFDGEQAPRPLRIDEDLAEILSCGDHLS